jgi:hypothetical protein
MCKIKQKTWGIATIATICMVFLLLPCMSRAGELNFGIYFEKYDLPSAQKVAYLQTKYPQNTEIDFFSYVVEIYVEPEGKVSSATVYTPNGTPVILSKDEDEWNTEIGYTSLDNLIAEFPPGQYSVVVEYSDAENDEEEITVPPYSETTFPDLPPASLSTDASGQLILNWQTVPDVDWYETFAVQFLITTAEEVHEGEHGDLSHPQDITTPLGVQKSEGEYVVGIESYAPWPSTFSGIKLLCSLEQPFPQCENDDDCPDGVCTDNVCVDYECEVDGDCTDGTCESNVCKDYECMVDGDCPDSTCVDNLCETVCSYPPEVKAFDEDESCFLSKDELKAAKTFYKDKLKDLKDALKVIQTEDKVFLKDLKAKYSE